MEITAPSRMLTFVGRECPGIWKIADLLHAREYVPPPFLQPMLGGHFLEDWKENIFVPLRNWRTYLMERRTRNLATDPKAITLKEWAALTNESWELVIHVSSLVSATAAWRPTQDIVCFDPDVLAGLKDTSIDAMLPAEILRRMPAWCVYFHTPGIHVDEDGDRYDGFFALYDMEFERESLCLAFVPEDGRFVYRIPICIGDWTLGEAMRWNRANTERDPHPDPYRTVEKVLPYALNLVIYVCAYGLEDRTDPQERKAAFPKPKKTKKGWRIFPPDRPRIRMIGCEFGDMIRASRCGTSASGYTMRPHIRRAHWHSFWTGSKSAIETRKLVVKWLPPIQVGGKDMEPEGAVA